MRWLRRLADILAAGFTSTYSFISTCLTCLAKSITLPLFLYESNVWCCLSGTWLALLHKWFLTFQRFCHHHWGFEVREECQSRLRPAETVLSLPINLQYLTCFGILDGPSALQDEDDTILQNVRSHISSNTVSRPRRPASLITLLWKLLKLSRLNEVPFHEGILGSVDIVACSFDLGSSWW